MVGNERFVEKKYIWIPAVLVLGTILVNIKSILSDFDVDSQYALVMAYRLAQGDRLIAQMWEPHQTSAFLCALLVRIYLILFGTTTGVVLYLHLMGVILKAICTYGLYKTLKKYLHPVQLFFICVFFFSVFPKGLPMPEFSNMLIWSSAGLFCCLVCFLDGQGKIRQLILAAVFLCLLVLSYPSCVIVYAGVVGLLFLYTKKTWRNVLVLTGVCLAIGISLLGWIVSYMGLEKLLQNMQYILMGDSAHSESLASKFAGYAQDLGEMFLVLLVAAVPAGIVFGICMLVYRIRHREFTAEIRKKCWGISFWSMLFIYFGVHTLLVVDRFGHLVVYIPIIVMALRNMKLCSQQEKKIVCIGMVISLLSFLAALLLSNLPVSASMSYLELAVCVSVIPITKNAEKYFHKCNQILKYSLIWAFCFLTVFRSGYIFKPMNAYVDSIWILRGNLSRVVEDGPARGIVTEYMGADILNTSIREWEEYVKDGDRILLVGKDAVSTLGYLYKDTVISVDSTISTPTYGEKLLQYWEDNPQKYPNVVIIDSRDGRLSVDEDSWIMQWVENEFGPYIYNDGSYWRYYRADETVSVME